MAKSQTPTVVKKTLKLKGAELTASLSSKEMLRARDELLKLLEGFHQKRRPHVAVFMGAVLLQAVINSAEVNGSKKKGGKRGRINE